MKALIIRLLPRCCLSFWHKFKLRIDYFYYKRRIPGLTQKIFSQEKIKVVFFPINIGMWKNDYLFELFMKHPRFEPYIISFFVPIDSKDYQRRNQQEMKSFFQSKGYPYIDMYNFETNEWFDIKSINPDLVFYTQAVDVAYPQYNIKSLWKDSLFYYIPYCLIIANEKAGFNTLLFNIAKKVFAPSEFIKEYWSSFFLNKAQNVYVTGYPSFDYLTHPTSLKSQSNYRKPRKKTIIWAPHHSISDNDVFSHSIFMDIADKMLDLVNKYKNDIHFVFKPHPRLKPKLEQHNDWGVERTSQYYRFWEDMPNTSLQDGEYFDLFLNSDAMIHDCITFIAEYLLTSKPALFVCKPDANLDLNEYGQGCFNQHYISHTIESIDEFISNVVISQNDINKVSRECFVNDYLLPKNGNLVAENIFNEICTDLL